MSFKWTKEVPRKSGLYWMWNTGAKQAAVVEIFVDGPEFPTDIYYHGEKAPVSIDDNESCHFQFLGPIPQPELPTDF
jgi:hypothetical protein